MTNTPHIVATLRVTSVDGSCEVIKLRRDQSLRFGRDETNDFVLNDSSVSRIHATFSASESGLVIADLSSTNGTFVNGGRIGSLRDLSTGDMVDVGGTKIFVTVFSQDAMAGRGEAGKRAMTAQLKPMSVSVLVASLGNFKTLCSELPTARLAELQFRWNNEISSCVRRSGGRVDKVVGPSIVAVWAAAEAEQQACAALQAALDIKLAGASGIDRRSGGAELKTCISVSSGVGLRGILGAPGASDDGFTILGDPTNVAFRIQELFADIPETLLVPDATRELAANEYIFRQVAEAPVGEGEELVPVFSVDPLQE